MRKKIQEKVDAINNLWSSFSDMQKARVRDYMLDLCGFHLTTFYRKVRDGAWTPLEAEAMLRRVEEVNATPDVDYESDYNYYVKPVCTRN